MAAEQSQIALNWLMKNVFPLWSTVGIEPVSGAFAESISVDGVAQYSGRRALVQARQIYSFVQAYKLQIINLDTVTRIVEKAVGHLISHYATKSGAYIHSVDIHGNPLNQDLDLYTQAFVIFGLAQAYDILRKLEIKHEALKVLKYLETNRRNKFGGYTEIKNGQNYYQSNPQALSNRHSRRCTHR